MQVKVEVKQPQGEVKQGNSTKNGRPYKMAEQEVAIFPPGADFPVVGRRDIYVAKHPDGSFGEPEWMKPGTYVVDVRVHTDRFGRIECSLDWRKARAVVSQAPRAAA